jgi:hypothetical protein
LLSCAPLLSIKRTSSTRSPFWFEQARGLRNVSTHLPFGSGHDG